MIGLKKTMTKIGMMIGPEEDDDEDWDDDWTEEDDEGIEFIYKP